MYLKIKFDTKEITNLETKKKIFFHLSETLNIPIKETMRFLTKDSATKKYFKSLKIYPRVNKSTMMEMKNRFRLIS